MLEIVLSVAVLTCLIVVVLGCLDCLFKKNRFQAFGIRDTTHAEHNAAFSVDIFDADNISEQVIIEPLPDILSKVSSVPVLRPRITCTERGKQEAALSLLSVQRSFPRDHLKYFNEIGSGWFGKVIQSEAVQIVAESYTRQVVVKMLKDDASKMEQKQFMEEVNSFRCLEHTNLIRFLGQCTETTPFLVILEFAAHGTLKSYLVQQRQDVDTLITTNRLVNFALDAASGLACLHRHDYIHNDLAARNCLVMSDYTLKIGDYGISDHLFKDEYFNTGTELLPVRWMAPETLIQVDGVWTAQKCNKISDMWSFGILLWEICSLGELPYDNLTDELVLQNVVRDRLVLPSDVKTKLPFKVKMWSVMIQCWEQPSQRIEMEQAVHILEQLKTKFDAMATVSDFDLKWNHLESYQGKQTSISLGNKPIATNNFVIDFPLNHDTPLFYDEFEAPDGATRNDVIINIDSDANSASRGHKDLSAPKICVQPAGTVLDHNLSMIQQSDSSYASQCQVMLVNELKAAPVSVSHLTANVLHDHAASVSQGSGSTSQFYSPHSSPSSEYMTVSESNVASGIQEETVKELSSMDKDNSMISEELSFTEFTDETLQNSGIEGGSSIVNNNNVLSKFIPASSGEDDEFSDYVHKSPTKTTDVGFTNLECAVTIDSDFLSIDNGVLEGDLCNKDTSFLKTVSASAVDVNATSSIFSVASVYDVTSVDSHRNVHANFPASESPDKAIYINSIPITINPFAPSILNGAITPDLVSTILHSQPKNNFLIKDSEPETNSSSKDVFTSEPNDSTDFPVLGMARDLQIISESNTPNINVVPVSQDETSEREELSDQKQSDSPYTLLSLLSESTVVCDNLNSGTSNEVLPMQSKQLNSLTDLQEHSRNVEVPELPHSPTIKDVLEESASHFSGHDSSNAFNSVEFLDHMLSFSDPSNVDEQTSCIVNGKTEMSQDKTTTMNKNESNSAESGIHTHSLAESPVNHIGNYSEVDYSMFLSDSPVYGENQAFSDSSGAVVHEDDYEQDTWPLASNLYRCSRINLTEDTHNVVQTEDNFRSSDDHDNNCQEYSQSPVDSDTESSNSGSEQEYICLSDQNSSGQPLTSSPNIAITNQSSASHRESSSSGDFDDYALQIASEIYLSRGVKSPRKFEIPPLETIPEHQPMPGIQEDSNYTPSDTSSMEVRYEEMFGGDSYEWDDFYGDSLIGKDISLHHNPSFREHEVSDWSMDIDCESIASGTSLPSMLAEEAPFNVSAQSEQQLSKTDISVDSGKNIHLGLTSELVASPYSKIANSSKETLVSSLLSHLQSPGASSVSSVDQNNFYTLTQRYDLETDSSSDGIASPPAAMASPAKSLTSSLPLPPPAQTLHPYSPKTSEQHSDHVLPESLNPNMSSSKSSATEEPVISSEISDEATNPLSSLLDHNSDLHTIIQNNIVPSKNINNEEQLKSENFTSVLDILHPNIPSYNGSSDSDKVSVILESQDADRSSDTLSSQVVDSSFIDL